MEKYLKYFILIGILFSTIIISGCATTQPFQIEPPVLPNITPMPKYESKIDEMKKPEIPNFVFMHLDEKTGTYIILPDNAPQDQITHIAMSPSDFSKIEQLLDLCITYKNVAKTEEQLVNTNIDIINQYLQRLQIEREITRNYFELWQGVKQDYYKEKKDHRIDNIINRVSNVVTIVGGIAIFSLI